MGESYTLSRLLKGRVRNKMKLLFGNSESPIRFPATVPKDTRLAQRLAVPSTSAKQTHPLLLPLSPRPPLTACEGNQTSVRRIEGDEQEGEPQPLPAESHGPQRELFLPIFASGRQGVSSTVSRKDLVCAGYISREPMPVKAFRSH